LLFQSEQSKAFAYLNQSLKIREENQNDRGLITSYYHLSEYYNKNNLTLANKYAYLAYKKATTINSVDDRLECLELIIRNSKFVCNTFISTTA
jgi:hypothetical protein